MSERQKPKLGTIATILIAIVIIGPLILAFSRLANEHRKIVAELRHYQGESESLRTAIEERNDFATQREANKRAVLDVLSHCRNAEDIPNLPGEHIVAKLRTSPFRVFFFVPKGDHTLRIYSEAKPHETPQDNSDPVAEKSSPNDGTKQESWSIPLVGNTGYLLTLSDHSGGRKSIPIGWQLDGNNVAFEKQEDLLPVEGFQARSWSHYSRNTYVQPNKRRRVRGGELAPEEPGVTVMNARLGGPWNEENYIVRFTVRVESNKDNDE